MIESRGKVRELAAQNKHRGPNHHFRQVGHQSDQYGSGHDSYISPETDARVPELVFAPNELDDCRMSAGRRSGRTRLSSDWCCA
jgi:hypothetical protein